MRPQHLSRSQRRMAWSYRLWTTRSQRICKSVTTGFLKADSKLIRNLTMRMLRKRRSSWNSLLSRTDSIWKLPRRFSTVSWRSTGQSQIIWIAKGRSWIRKKRISTSKIICRLWESKSGFQSTFRRIKLRRRVSPMIRRLANAKWISSCLVNTGKAEWSVCLTTKLEPIFWENTTKSCSNGTRKGKSLTCGLA